ncbi:MFS transporter, partial [Pseudoalteromonas sp. S3178]
NPLRILKYAMFLLAITCIIFVHMPNFELLLATRFIQGLILPAALTAMTTYIGQQYQSQTLHKNMTRYIASSIMGGYLGRVLSANFAAF